MFASTLNSDCVNNIFVNPLTRSADVEFQDGSVYHYENLTPSAVINYFMMSAANSYGEWVNKYLLDTRFNGNTTYEFVGYEVETNYWLKE